MGTATFCLDTFEVLTKKDVDKDEPYIWVIGLLIDRNAFLEQSYVVKKNPTYGNIGDHYAKGEKRSIKSDLGRVSRSLAPLSEGKLGFGVIVVAFEHDTTSQEAQQEAYDIAVDTIHDEIKETVGKGSAPTAAQFDAIKDELQASIRVVFKADTKWYNWLFLGGVDDYVGTDNEVWNLVEGKPLNKGFTLRVGDGDADYRIVGNMTWTG